MSHGYEAGRLNLPFVGISTFAKKPYVEDWDALSADVAVLGAPFDFGTQWRSGARFGPRGVREASTLFAFGHAGAYDHEDDAVYLGEDVRIVDMGDADIVHTDTEKSHANIEYGVRKALSAGALPVVIGGGHSVKSSSRHERRPSGTGGEPRRSSFQEEQQPRRSSLQEESALPRAPQPMDDSDGSDMESLKGA